MVEERQLENANQSATDLESENEEDAGEPPKSKRRSVKGLWSI
jgi:hypothetical protein